jgi:pimeloyl-ACP methyl ester carboxylesterase
VNEFRCSLAHHRGRLSGRPGRRRGLSALVALAVAVAVMSLIVAPAEAAFPGANGKLAFARAGHIWTVNPDGSDETQLTHGHPGDHFPTWSADGTQIAFSRMPANDAQSEEFFYADIWVMNADGSEQRNITNAPLDSDVQPTWSPDGTRIAFSRVDERRVNDERHYESDVWAINADGSGLVNLTGMAAYDTYLAPVWSPDGSRLAFTGEDNNIWLVGADGSGLAPLTDNIDEDVLQNQRVSWSPDGTRIAWARRRSAVGEGPRVGDIFAVEADGSGQTQLTDGSLDASMPVWSPDGEQIIFTSGFQGLRQTVVMGADGANPTLVADLNYASHLDWGPVVGEPVVFVHGFLGSVMACDGQEVWPRIDVVNRPRLLDLRLAADGVTNADCASAGPTGAVVESVMGSDVYASTLGFLQSTWGERHAVYAWDWRKSPEQALAGLDAVIDETLEEHDAEQVVLYAHSMGGLVTRWYINDQERADKVARALTVGTPYQGAPKSVFPLAGGVEAPGWSQLDPLLDNDDLKAFAVNLGGLYYLWPSAAYGDWLTVHNREPKPLDRPALLAYVSAQLGGNAGLLADALDGHATHLDGFVTNGVDYRVVAGSGVHTIAAVELRPGTGVFGGDRVRLAYGNGDGTVPLASAINGEAGAPHGEAIDIGYTCGVSHVPLPGHPAATGGFVDFLRDGSDFTGLEQICAASGKEITAHAITLGPSSTAVPVGSAAGESAVSLDEAEVAGLLDVIDLNDQTVIVADDETPVVFDLDRDHDYALTVTPLHDGVRGQRVVYGPLRGVVTIDTDGDVTVTRAGQVLGPADPAFDPDPDEPAPAPEEPRPDDPPDADPNPERSTACQGRAIPPPAFTDTSGNTHRAAIDCVVFHGVAQGTSSTTYAPAATVTRAQMASFIARLVRASGTSLPRDANRFHDIAGDTHRVNIERLAAAGIVQGTGGGRYEPGATVTRAQMGSFLARAFAYIDGEQLPVAPAGFTDIAGDTHADNIRRIAGAGFALGTTATTYAPAEHVRRDQMASFLARMLERLATDNRL